MVKISLFNIRRLLKPFLLVMFHLAADIET